MKLKKIQESKKLLHKVLTVYLSVRLVRYGFLRYCKRKVTSEMRRYIRSRYGGQYVREVFKFTVRLDHIGQIK